MGQTKADALASGVTNQQALVKAMIQKADAPRRLIVPGGQDLLQQLDGRVLKQAIYNWLRGVRWFDRVKFGLVTGDVERKTRTYRAMEFPDSPAQMRAWDMVALGGKRWLAEKIADVLLEKVILNIEARPDGLYVTEPTDTEITAESLQASEDWQPHLDFVVRGKGEYAIR